MSKELSKELRFGARHGASPVRRRLTSAAGDAIVARGGGQGARGGDGESAFGVPTLIVAKGRPPELRAGPGFASYERRRDAAGHEIEEFITIVPVSEPTLFAVSDDQFNAWKGKRLIAKPVRLEPR